MLKKSIASLLFLFASVGSAFAADAKVAVVDINAVFSKVANASISEKDQQSLKEQQEALQALQKKGKELQEQAKRDEMTLTGAQKLDISRQLKALDSEFNLKQTFLNEDLAYAKKKGEAAILQRILKAISTVAEKENYDVVLRAESTLYAKNATNITDKVIAVLNDPAG